MAAPSLAIAEEPDDVYKYTGKGNLVAAITGFDILGQLSSTYYNVNSHGSSEYRVNPLNRYVMLSLKYKFNLGPKK